MGTRNRLTAAKLRHLAPGRHCDGGGLYAVIGPASASWVFRYRSPSTGKLRDFGLGPLADVPLALAREKATACRLQLLDGTDPIDNAHEKRVRARVAIAKRLTFGQCADRYIAAHRAGWRNPKHAAQWTATLSTYCAPITGLPVADVDVALVLKCLEPDWTVKHETMTRVRQRMEAVLDWATARRYRSGENPARWRGHLDKILPTIGKRKRVKHRAALPYAEIPGFMGELRKRQGLGARALELQVLTATRPGEAAGAQWDEIDLDAALWTIPAARMKAGVEHRVPLSAAAAAMLRTLPRVNENVFPGVKGNPITTAAAMALLHDLRPGLTAHGFRSTFRDWAGDSTAFARDVVEAALAHTITNAAEAAYRRGDALRKRAKLMDAWAGYCAAMPAKGSVTPIQRKRA